jgi:ATP-binding cassette subfamily B protein
MVRLTEPLRAPDEEAGSLAAQPTSPTEKIPATPNPLPGVAVHLHEASVTAGGHSILHNVTLTLQSNEHVAVAGASGAGKSTLAGLLLGWHRPISGSVQIDGNELTPATLPALRRTTAWIDPAVQLWNRSLLENLRYGNLADTAPLSNILELADLDQLIERLPNGLQSSLGEGGALVSGGKASGYGWDAPSFALAYDWPFWMNRFVGWTAHSAASCLPAHDNTGGEAR